MANQTYLFTSKRAIDLFIGIRSALVGFRVIECKGPTNTRVYTVAVYFRGRRLASAVGHSIQQAEMNAAKKALEISQGSTIFFCFIVLVAT